MMKLRGIFLLLVIAGLSGCTQASPVVPPAATTPRVATAQPLAAASPAPTLAPSPLPPAALPASPMPAQPSQAASLTPMGGEVTPAAGPLVQANGTLTVQLFAGMDMTVSSAVYLLSGTAPAGTVVSVNDEVLLVDSSQSFSTPVALEEGPNLVEVVASDEAGQEVSFLITVTYLPDS